MRDVAHSSKCVENIKRVVGVLIPFPGKCVETLVRRLHLVKPIGCLPMRCIFRHVIQPILILVRSLTVVIKVFVSVVYRGCIILSMFLAFISVPPEPDMLGGYIEIQISHLITILVSTRR